MVFSIFSLLIAAAALSITIWRWWVERPSLRLEQERFYLRDDCLIETADKHDGIAVQNADGSGCTQYIRARACNDSRGGTARSTQVLAYIPATTGHPGLDVRSLRWGSAEVGEGAEPVDSLDIPPGVQRHIDIIECSVPESDPSRAQVRVAREPSGEGHVLGEGTTCIQLIAACEGRGSSGYELEVEFDGRSVKVKSLRKKKGRAKTLGG
ncbi:MAG: hypothetical protein J0H66_04305 [Solirubrobacterales bacterium]|nr:hypothetical protein [Solirubrobacterales bacterium]